MNSLEVDDNYKISEQIANECFDSPKENLEILNEEKKNDNFENFNNQNNQEGSSESIRKNGKWSPEEDDYLKQLVNKFGPKNWKIISDKLITRSPVQCLHRWTKILQPGLKKGPWTIEEDNLLAEWVKREGPCKWSLCGDFIKGRSGKQCRERWFNTLNPVVKKGSWTAKEDYLIFELFLKYGSKWSQITSHLKGRSENSIKNRFYSTLRRICAENKKLASTNDDSNKINFYLSNLEELLKYVPQAYEEKKKKYLESIDEDEESSSNEEKSLLGSKRTSELNSTPESRRNNHTIKLNTSPKLIQSEPQTPNNNIIKIPMQNILNTLPMNYSPNMVSYIKPPSFNFTPQINHPIEPAIMNSNNDNTYLKLLFIKIKQLESHLKRAHSEIKRFDMISNAYTALSGQDYNSMKSTFPINWNTFNNDNNMNIINSFPYNAMPTYNLLNYPNMPQINQIMTNK